jgi:hypothetical protein
MKFKRMLRGLVWVVLMAMATVSLTGCNAQEFLSKILPIIQQVIPAVAGLFGNNASAPANVANASQAAILNAVPRVASTTATVLPAALDALNRAAGTAGTIFRADE